MSDTFEKYFQRLYGIEPYRDATWTRRKPCYFTKWQQDIFLTFKAGYLAGRRAANGSAP